MQHKNDHIGDQKTNVSQTIFNLLNQTVIIIQKHYV